MSVFRKMFLSFNVVLAFISLSVSSANAQNRQVSLQVFYDELAYHGDWIDNQEYGYVWRPNVGADFRPYYTNGRWVMTQYGNTWVSDFEWGWAPFHYGRWYYDNYDGWLWIPDTEWGPAWVDWRTGGGYYGWAPMGPRISISVNIGPRYYPDSYWVFIPQRYIYYNNYGRYWSPRNNVTIIRNTTIINNVYVNNNVRYVSGPAIRDVRRATGSNVRVHRIENASRPGSSRVDRNSVSVYRPQIDRSASATPNRVVAANSSRPERSSSANVSRPSTGRDRNNNDISSRPNRGTTDNRPVTPRTNGASNRGSLPERSSRPTERPARERSVQPNSPARESSRPQSAPQRVERQSPSGVERAPSRTESARPSAPQRVERPSAPQRQDRPSSSPQRMERPSGPSMDRGQTRSSSHGAGSAGQARSSSSNSSRPERSGR